MIPFATQSLYLTVPGDHSLNLPPHYLQKWTLTFIEFIDHSWQRIGVAKSATLVLRAPGRTEAQAAGGAQEEQERKRSKSVGGSGGGFVIGGAALCPTLCCRREI